MLSHLVPQQSTHEASGIAGTGDGETFPTWPDITGCHFADIIYCVFVCGLNSGFVELRHGVSPGFARLPPSRFFPGAAGVSPPHEPPLLRGKCKPILLPLLGGRPLALISLRETSRAGRRSSRGMTALSKAGGSRDRRTGATFSRILPRGKQPRPATAHHAASRGLLSERPRELSPSPRPPCVGQGSIQSHYGLGPGSPQHQRRREGSSLLAVTQPQPTAKEIHDRPAGDVLMPIGRVRTGRQ